MHHFKIRSVLAVGAIAAMTAAAASAAPPAHVSIEEEANGIGLACRVHPTSNLELQVVGAMRKSVLAQRAVSSA